MEDSTLDDREAKKKPRPVSAKHMTKTRAPETTHVLGSGGNDGVRASQEALWALINATSDILFLMDRNGIIITANENAAHIYDRPLPELIGTRIYDLFPPRRAARVEERVKRVIESGKPVRFEGILKGNYYDNTIYPAFDPSGKVTRLTVYISDITERKNMEAALHLTEEKYRNIFENATEGIFQISPEGRFLSANPSLAHIHGYDSPEELINTMTDMGTQLYVNPEDRSMLLSLLHKYDGVQNFEVPMYRKDRSLHWISINTRAVKDKDGRFLYHEGTMQDITDRKKAQGALAESEERYRTAIEHSNDGVAIIRGVHHQYVNRRFVEMFGYDRAEEIIGRPLFFVVHPDDREKVLNINMLRQKGKPVPSRYEFKGITKDGKVLHVEVSATVIVYRGSPAYLVYLRDITERKRAEEALIRSHTELERLNRMKTKAVNHISHELRTPLSVVQGNVRILKRKLAALGGDSGFRGIIDTLERNLDRLFAISRETDEIFRVSQELEAGLLVSDLDRLWQRMEDLSEIPPAVRDHWNAVKGWMDQYLSTGTLTFQTIDLYPFIRTIVEKSKRMAAHRRLDFQVHGENDLFIRMDPLILTAVCEGLIKNAIENTPDGGIISLVVEQETDAVLLHVTDTGTGILEEDLQYVFDGLFHTKETALYTSKKPYDFGAGGKGLDLLRMKILGQRFGFTISVKSNRCPHIPSDNDLCPGDVLRCPSPENRQDCKNGGGTTFTVSFPSRVIQSAG
jgi:PAS domain S-box-containing protein